MTRDFLGSGWAFPVQPDQGGGIATSAFERNIYESILVILGTRPGERPLFPLFGCGIHDFVFAPNNSSTHGIVEHQTTSALLKWEPRIRDVKVKAKTDPDEPARMLVEIAYTVRSTNSVYNLVYPFYLQGS